MIHSNIVPTLSLLIPLPSDLALITDNLAERRGQDRRNSSSGFFRSNLLLQRRKDSRPPIACPRYAGVRVK